MRLTDALQTVIDIAEAFIDPDTPEAEEHEKAIQATKDLRAYIIGCGENAAIVQDYVLIEPSPIGFNSSRETYYESPEEIRKTLIGDIRD